MRKTFLAGSQNLRHAAAQLFNSLDYEFHFPLNQDSDHEETNFQCLGFFTYVARILSPEP